MSIIRCTSCQKNIDTDFDSEHFPCVDKPEWEQAFDKLGGKTMQELKGQNDKVFLEYEYVPSQEQVQKHIQDCEGKHTQQAVYSTFHDALTQICYGCRKVRSSLRKTL